MAPPLKHGLARPAISRLARNLERASPPFDVDGFVRAATKGLKPLELKERVAHIADSLASFLPSNYPGALKIIVDASKTWDRGDEDDPLRGFAAWPLFDFIEKQGAGDFKRSMAALRSITHLFSAEFAVRTFLASEPKRAFAEFTRWSSDPSEQVRRLVSEGTRPRLPWARRVQALIDDPAPVLALLELLKDDPALYVRRSVANNLNDISKDHPDLVIDVCEAWLEEANAERRWIVERATRTIVKAGHPRVWGLLGFTKRPKIAVSAVVVEPVRIRIGEDISFTFELQSKARSLQRLAVDYRVHYVKANGKQRPKVFKLKVLDLPAKAVVEITRRQSFRKISTRKYYPGQHALDVLVNGKVVARTEFDVRK